MSKSSLEGTQTILLQEVGKTFVHRGIQMLSSLGKMGRSKCNNIVLIIKSNSRMSISVLSQINGSYHIYFAILSPTFYDTKFCALSNVQLSILES